MRCWLGAKPETEFTPTRLETSTAMAKNLPSGDNRRVGCRSHLISRTTGGWVARDSTTGQFIDQKADPKPFKGVVKRSRSLGVCPFEHPTKLAAAILSQCLSPLSGWCQNGWTPHPIRRKSKWREEHLDG